MLYTINRQCGSGGREIGQIIARERGIPFYSKEILEIAARESGISKEHFEENDEKVNTAAGSLIYAFSIPGSGNEMPLNHKLFMAQFEAIRKLAKEGPAVFVGRCADYALRDRKDKVSAFIYADLGARYQRTVNDYGIPEKQAKSLILKTDKQRGSYYKFYTDRDWEDMQNYDLMVNSAVLGTYESALLILDFAKRKAERLGLE